MFIAFIGPFPPPLHGMSKNLKFVADEIEKTFRVLRLSTSPGSLNRSIFYYTKKTSAVLLSFFRLFFFLIINKIKSVYIPPDAGLGIIFTIMFALVTRFFSKPIFFHHRSFAYIDSFSLGMFFLVLIGGKNATHIFLCEKMRCFFIAKYKFLRFPSLVISNHLHIKPQHCKKKTDFSSLTLGFLSNLSFAKGIKRAVDTIKELNKLNCNSRLIIAGPYEDDLTKFYLKEQLNLFPKYLSYSGAISHSKIGSFFNLIDVFIFPSLYRNEAQPNVVLEAMAYGIPVISLDRGCISSDIIPGTGFVFEESIFFANSAAVLIKNLIEDPILFNRLKRNAFIVSSKKHSAAIKAFDKFKRCLLQH